MIYNILTEKDTYVANINLANNDSLDANVGKSSTLDLFKLYNENKEAYSKAFLEVNENIVDDSTLTIVDSFGTSKTFIFKLGEAFAENDLQDDKVKIGFLDLVNNAPLGYANRISDAINAVGDLKINAYSNANNDLVLIQQEKGQEGDKDFVLPNSGILNKTSEDKFSRIEFSAILIKLKIEEFKNNNIDIDNIATGIFNDVKVVLSLKDVTTGLNKPKNYEIAAYRLLKDFKEGTGSDVIYFSDKDVANFKNLSDETWEIPGFISKGLDVAEEAVSDQVVDLGEEDFALDITDYFVNIITGVFEDKGLLLTFKDEFIFNNNSYFVKRLGSRHLINTSLRPNTILLANDQQFKINLQKENVNRFFNSAEVFYFVNNLNGNFKNFTIPNGFTLKAKIVDASNSSLTYVENLSSISDVFNIDGTIKQGFKKGTLDSTQLDFFNQDVQNNIINQTLKTELIWFIENDNDAEDTVVLQKVDINFSNSYGLMTNIDKYITTSVAAKENDLISNDDVYRFFAFFNDPKLDNSPVKTPIALSSLNLGNVFYSIYDVDNQKELLSFYDNAESKFATQAFYDGEKYVFDVQLTEKFKNKRINFKFKNKDPLSNENKILTNKRIALKVN